MVLGLSQDSVEKVINFRPFGYCNQQVSSHFDVSKNLNFTEVKAIFVGESILPELNNCQVNMFRLLFEIFESDLCQTIS